MDIPLQIAHELDKELEEAIGLYFSIEEYINYLERKYKKRIICELRTLNVRGLIYECSDAYVIQINKALAKLNVDAYRLTVCHEGTHIRRGYVPYYDHSYEYIKQNEAKVLKYFVYRDGDYNKLEEDIEEDIAESTASLHLARLQKHDEVKSLTIPSAIRKLFGYEE